MINLKKNCQVLKYFNYSKRTPFSLLFNIKIDVNKNKFLTRSIHKKKFCEKIKEQEEKINSNEDFKRYDHDYESPENKEFSFKTMLERISIFLLKVSTLSVIIYFSFLKKYNEISKERELFFINDNCENWLSNKISNKLQNYFFNYIYKEETEECVRINKIYTNLLEKNKIIVKNKKVFVLKIPNIGCFLLKNGDLFISSNLIDFAENDEEIYFFIAQEISLIVNGKFLLRIVKSYINFNFFNSFLGKFFTKGDIVSGKIDYSENKISKFKKLDILLSFFPENPNLTYFDQVSLFKATLKLLTNAEIDLNKVRLYF